jgi:hypothetical protein
MEKAKYRVYVGSIEKYICVTTTRNTEEMLNILLDNYRGCERLKIIKEVKGCPPVVIHGRFNKNVKQARKVINLTTGEIFNSAKELSVHQKKRHVTIRRYLAGYIKSVKNFKYLDELNLLEQ